MNTVVQIGSKTDEETRQYHRKRLLELSLKSLGEIPQLEDPNQEQTEWLERRMRGSARNWETST